MTQTPLPRNPDGSLMRSEPSHFPESPGGYEVTWKQRLSDTWQTREFSDRDEAEHFAEEVAPFVHPDEWGRDVVPVG